MIESTPSGIKIAREIIELAQSRTEVADFKLQSRLERSLTGMAYFDRMRVADYLLAEGTISLRDGRLIISASHIPEWLRPKLSSGDQEAWNIADILEDSGLFIRKYESDLNSETGLAGELFIIEYLKRRLKPELFRLIDHVALRDDTCGYDIITPTTCLMCNRILLEVKTSLRPGQLFRFFLSRNEAEVGRKNRHWCLVAVRKTQFEFVMLGHIQYSTIEMMLPCNINTACTWESAMIEIPIDKFVAGLPGILEITS